MGSKITITGPRSVGKSTISKELSHITNISYFSGDDLMNKRLEKVGGLDRVIKSEKLNLIFDNALELTSEVLNKDSFILDYAGGGISSSKAPELVKRIISLLQEKSFVIGLLPFKDDKLSVNFLFKRELNRVHFKDEDPDVLYGKTKNIILN